MPGPAVRAEVAAGRLAFQRVSTRDGSHLLVVGGRIPGSAAELYVVHAEDRIYADLDQLRAVLIGGSVLVVLLAALIGHVLARRTLEPGRPGRRRRARGRRGPARHPAAGRRPRRVRGLGGVLQPDGGGAGGEDRRAVRRRRPASAGSPPTSRTSCVPRSPPWSPRRRWCARTSTSCPPSVRRPAELLVADVVRLRRLVDELMEISRLDAGREDVAVRPVEVGALVDAILGQPRAGPTGSPSPARRRTVATDPRRLERILANLVANAVEHGGARRPGGDRRCGRRPSSSG